MKYVALLRGINVGGNSMIKMSELKKVFEEAGLKNVVTYINSGNVIFESNEKQGKLTNKLEKALSLKFHYPSRLVLRSHRELKEIVQDIPSLWKGKNDLRCYIAFVREPVSPDEVLKEIKLKEGVDTVKKGNYVLYMSTKLSGITKSGFTKLVGTKVYQDITIRGLSTAQKLLALMEKTTL